jgi:predicted RND superfamily exporter protein
MGGWKLGVSLYSNNCNVARNGIVAFPNQMLESLNLVLVVGLSVDYVVHLAEGYSRSLRKDRLGRVQDMLEEVGISVVSGAFTTLGASFFLLFAEILFFTQFGLFMFSTIGLSLLFACIFFSTVMGIMGPQDEVGSLKPLYRAIGKFCCRREK